MQATMKIVGCFAVVVFACTLEECIKMPEECLETGVLPLARSHLRNPVGEQTSASARRPANFKPLAGRYKFRSTISTGSSRFRGSGKLRVGLKNNGRKALFRLKGIVRTPLGDRGYSMDIAFQKNKSRGVINFPGFIGAAGVGKYTGRKGGLNFTLAGPISDTFASTNAKVRKRGRNLIFRGLAANEDSMATFKFVAR